MFFCTNTAASKSIILSCIIILYEKLKNYSIQAWKECLYFIFCLFGFLLLSSNTFHLMYFTYICYWSTFSIKIHYTNYFSCCKTISCASEFERYLFTVYHIISLFALFHEALLLKLSSNLREKSFTHFSNFLTILLFVFIEKYLIYSLKRPINYCCRISAILCNSKNVRSIEALCRPLFTKYTHCKPLFPFQNNA